MNITWAERGRNVGETVRTEKTVMRLARGSSATGQTMMMFITIIGQTKMGIFAKIPGTTAVVNTDTRYYRVSVQTPGTTGCLY